MNAEARADAFRTAADDEARRRADAIEEAYELRVIEGQVHRVTVDGSGCEVVRLHGAHYGNCSVCEQPLTPTEVQRGGVCARCDEQDGFWGDEA